jgi:2-polyprenyl-3-methyl-5-hydroxy-6-metoxy-1,4-benzoquinol methylase
MKRVADDDIYTSCSVHSVPHRIRAKQVVSRLRKIAPKGVTYADVGCGGGSITQQIVEAIRPSRAVGYDCNADLLRDAAKLFSEISFRCWNLTGKDVPAETYDLVTCLETLEHVEDLKSGLSNLLKLTAGRLLITVPIELGLLGMAKFAAKTVLGRQPLGAEHCGTSLEYVKALLRGGDISRFRVRSNNGFWVSHTGFDYRKIDNLLASQGVKFVATNRGWNRFYQISVGTAPEK